MEKVSRRALLIGTSRYSNKAFHELIAPIEDINQLRRVLKEPQIGDYETRDLINQSSAILRKEIEIFYKRAVEEDTLLLYFSGHGYLDDYNNLHLITADTDQEALTSTSVPAEEVYNLIRRSRAERKILILDCCFSGAIADKLLKGDNINVQQYFGTGVAILTASTAYQYAYENTSDRESKKDNMSVFTKVLTEGLESGIGGTLSKSYITVQDLFEYVERRMKQLQARQEPQMNVVGQKGKIVIAKNPFPTADIRKLPQEILQDIRSPHTWRKKGVINELQNLVNSDDESIRFAAIEALNILSSDDSKEVSSAAESILSTTKGVRIPSPSTKMQDRQIEKVAGQRELSLPNFSFNSIYDYERLLFWVVREKDGFQKYRDTLDIESQKRLTTHCIWLATTITWLPLLLPSVLYELNSLWDTSHYTKIWRISLIVAAWFTSGYWGSVLEDNTAIVFIAACIVIALAVSSSLVAVNVPIIFATLLLLLVVVYAFLIIFSQEVAFEVDAFAVGIAGVGVGSAMLISIPILFGGGASEEFSCIFIGSLLIGGLNAYKNRNWDILKIYSIIGAGLGIMIGLIVFYTTGRYTTSAPQLLGSIILVGIVVLGIASSIIFGTYKKIFFAEQP